MLLKYLKYFKYSVIGLLWLFAGLLVIQIQSVHPQLQFKYNADQLTNKLEDVQKSGFYVPQTDELGNRYVWTKKQVSVAFNYILQKPYKLGFEIRSAAVAGGPDDPVQVSIRDVPVALLRPNPRDPHFQYLEVQVAPTPAMTEHSLQIILDTSPFKPQTDDRVLGTMLKSISIDRSADWEPVEQRFWMLWTLPGLALLGLALYLLSRVRILGFVSYGAGAALLTGSIIATRLVLLYVQVAPMEQRFYPLWVGGSLYLALLFGISALYLLFKQVNLYGLYPNILKPRLIPVVVFWQKRPFLQAFLLLNLSLLIFLSTPIFTPNSIYLPVDALVHTDSKLYDNLPPYPGKSNINFIDPLRVFYPQLAYARERFLNGEIPLWNPYNANGMPNLASMQSAVFSPFSLPVYLFGMNLGWLLSQYLKLLMLGLFTYGFFRLLKINLYISLACAIAFTYSGYQAIWHLGPHIASLLVLPAGLFFVERTLQAQDKKGYLLNLTGLALTEAVGVLGGHIESFFFGTLVVALYILFRVWTTPGTLGSKLREYLQFAMFGMLGIGISAVQLVPFVEYMSTWVPYNRGQPVNVKDFFSILNVLPSIYGYLNQPYLIAPGMSIREFALAYTGASFVLICLWGAFWLRHNRLFWFFGLLSLILFGYMHNFFPINIWLNSLPLFKQMVAERAGPVVSFGECCMTALVLDQIYRKGFRLKTALIFGVATLAFIITLIGAAITNFEHLSIDTENSDFQHYVPYQIGYCVAFVVFFALGVFLLAQIRWSKLLRALGVGLILIISFAQSGLLLRDLNGTAIADYAFPNTEGTKALQSIAGSDSIAFYDITDYSYSEYLTPNTNMLYDLYDPRFFEALWVQPYEWLFNQSFNAHNIYERQLRKLDPATLKLFGIHYIASMTPPDIVASKSQVQAIPDPRLIPLINSRLDQTLVADNNNLSGVGVIMGNYHHTYANSCNLEFVLTEVSQPDKPIRQRSLACDTVFDMLYFPITFDPVPDSKGKHYQFSLWSPDATLTNKVTAFISPEQMPDTELRLNGEKQTGSLIFRHLYEPESSPYTRVWQNSRFSIFRYDDAVPRYYSVGKTVPLKVENLKDIKFGDKFDPAREAGLLPEDQLPLLSGNEYAPAKVLIDKPEYKKLEISRNTPGWLVTSLSEFPGWKVRINGIETKLVRTNFAFIGATLPAGTSTVEISYEPLSFQVGLALTVLSLLGLLSVNLYQLRRNRPPVVIQESPEPALSQDQLEKV